MKITSVSIREVLLAASPSPEQASFLEAFLSLVLEEVQARGDEDPGSVSVFVSVDLARLEVQVAAGAALMAELADRFLLQCGVPDRSAAAALQRVAAEMQASRAALWCRLRAMGSPAPQVDAGFSVGGDVAWPMADVLLPQVDDLHSLQRHSQQEQCPPRAYGSSMLPVPGTARSLEFSVVSAQASKVLLSGLGFFRALGFAKPEDALIRQLSLCKPDRCTVRADLGRDGLTQMSMRLPCCASKFPTHDIAKALDLEYNAPMMETVRAAIGPRPDLIEYGVDSQGFVVSVGYQS